MDQVGQTKVFTMTPACGTNVYSYAWRFWDGTSDATVLPTTAKVLNQGGNPLDGRLLRYTCTPVTIDGQEVTVAGSLQVNNPPSIVPSPSISANDQYLPFNARMQVEAYDVDQTLGDSYITFDWYMGSYALGNGTRAASYPFSGTWAGNGSTVVQTLTATPCYYDMAVYSDRTVRCYVQDYSGGISYVDFDLRGYIRPPVETGIVASTGNLGSDASALPIKRIGYGEYFSFVVDAKDAVSGPLNFSWNCAGSNGWTVGATGAGASSLNPDGSWRSTFLKDLTYEVCTSGTQKTATAVCTVISPTERTDVAVSVILLANSGPSAVSVVMHDGTAVGHAAILPGDTVPHGTKIEYSAVITDPEGDIGYMFWRFEGLGTPSSNQWFSGTRMVGPKVVMDTSYAGGITQVAGDFVAVDRLLQPAFSGTIPNILLNP